MKPNRLQRPQGPRSTTGRWLVAAFLACGLAACGGGDDDDDQPPPVDPPADATVVNTQGGIVKGSQRATLRAWLGIPYAAPPVGALRWKPPQPAAAWAGVREATAFGNHCPQPDTAPLQYGTPGGQEDCLYLNVYAPTTPGPHPVMVWVHGGAFYLGRSNGYDPTRLVEQGVVVVTLNYRLGALGFLAHPALNDAQGRSGNYALMDQQLALKWVQSNIANFGGDAGNVTLFGQSAGGASVVTQLASPLAAGLFHKAIVQSGGYMSVQPSGAAAQAAGVAAAATLGCPDDANAANCLRALPVDQIVAKQPRAYAPNVDGALLTQTTAAAFASASFNKVPVLTGATHDEYTVFQYSQSEMRNGPLTAADYPAAVAAAVVGTALSAEQALALYPLSAYESPSLAISALRTDATFVCGGRRLARGLMNQVPVYTYEFDDPNAPMSLQPPASFPYKSYHAAEIQYLFDVPTAAGQTLNAQQRDLAASLVAYWTNFAKTGNPNGTTASAWPRYDANDRYWRLAPEGNAVITDLSEEHHCEAWTPGV
ncbi:carboxylesterase/lipase family protein [Caldimonas brevitalea]|uniref:Carboxylic ester hydrolase n=1 Tax=Caldimonas brevitalea TaxID=413882 RepID=A0A0G3BS48_9BURK|nr:carboxylesterase family protein [Caldimonas brevitalea]AKJ30236.1 para-nitrobenzyl esterase [Caldimonas brevitalea]